MRYVSKVTVRRFRGRLNTGMKERKELGVNLSISWLGSWMDYGAID